MAASTHKVTDLNFIRIIRLFSEIGKDCLLKAFYSFVQKENVQIYFQSDKIQNRIDDLLKRGILVGDQYDKLKDNNIQPDEFDLAMLFVLLRYVIEEVQAPDKGWHSLPSVGDNSLGACLLKVQRIRNEVVHNPNVELGDDEFEEKWDDLAHYLRTIIESVCGREDSKKVSKRIRELKNTSKEDLSRNLTQNVDQVFLWSASDFSRLQSKLAEGQIRSNSETRHSRKDGLDEPDAVRSDYATLQSDLETITNELQAVSVDEKANFSPSSTSTDSSQVVEKLNNMTRKVNDIYTWVQELMLRLHAQATQQVPMSRQGRGDFHGNREVNQRSRPFNPNAMTDKEIKTFSRDIGREFHHLALVLNFKQTQYDMLVRSFHGISEQTFCLVKAWHDVVVDCDENPKELLAAALLEIENRLLAVTYFGERFALAAQGKKPKAATIFKIQEINFEVEAQGRAPQHITVVNYGAPNSLNMFEGEMTIGGNLSISSDFGAQSLQSFGSYPGIYDSLTSNTSHSTFQGSSGSISTAVTNVAQPFSINVMGGKLNTAPGSFITIGKNVSCWDLSYNPLLKSTDVPDSSAATGGQFKKADDDSVTQTMLDCFAGHMKSVGALIVNEQVVGTAFRVGEKFLMTAAHVAKDIVDPEKKNELRFKNLTLVKINFNDSPMYPDRSNYKLKDFLYLDELHDAAILEIANPDTRLPPRMFLRKELVDSSLLKAVSIIGYGHPGSIKKHLEFKCKIVLPHGRDMSSAMAWLHKNTPFYRNELQYLDEDPKVVDLGYQNYDAPFKLLFHCFMEHGASGGPIIRVCQHAADTAASVEVIGIVTGGLPEFYFHLSKIRQMGVPDNKRFESGSRMSHIFETLKAKNRELAALLFNLPRTEPLGPRLEPMETSV